MTVKFILIGPNTPVSVLTVNVRDGQEDVRQDTAGHWSLSLPPLTWLTCPLSAGQNTFTSSRLISSHLTIRLHTTRSLLRGGKLEVSLRVCWDSPGIFSVSQLQNTGLEHRLSQT